MKSDLTQAKLKELLHYNPDTGDMVRIKATGRHGCHIAGVKVGYKGSRLGRIYIRLDKKLYFAHKLIWLYIHGYFPETDIDHINRNPSDNRLCNLRVVSHQCNLRNSKMRADNTTGVKGVGFRKDTGKYTAKIYVMGKHCSGGNYKSFDNAVCARLALEQSINWEGCDSSSPAYQYVQKMLGVS